MFFSCRTTGENFRSLPKFFKKNEREPLCRGDRCYAIVYDKNPLSSCVIKGLRNDAGRCVPSIFEMAESK
nr:MAG TPA: Phosphopantothenate/pantothenate synthetase [Caudoviricetes sp.]